MVFEDYPLAELVERIDWTPFFRSWELAGRFPDILTDEVVGTEATHLYADAQVMLQNIVAENWIQAKAVVGFFPANSIGDDIVLYTDATRSQTLSTLHNLRMQMDRNGQQPNYCLSDFVAPAVPFDSAQGTIPALSGVEAQFLLRRFATAGGVGRSWPASSWRCSSRSPQPRRSAPPRRPVSSWPASTPTRKRSTGWRWRTCAAFSGNSQLPPCAT